MAKSWILIFILFFIFTSSNFAFGQSVTDGIVIQAENMERNAHKNQIYLTGNVQLIFKGQHLVCEKAMIDLNTNEITAEGNVIVEGPQVHIEATLAKVNYKTNTGFFENGYLQSGQVVFEGKTLQKTGPEDYVAEEGYYTSCTNCAPDWSFSGKRVKARLGGYANISRPVFRVRGVPVLILPLIIVPLKSARQTGLLVPTMSHSNSGGFAPGGSYFWAISPSQDLTSTVKWYEKRGTKGIGQYRYVLSEQSKGDFHAGILQDKVFQIDNKLAPSYNRWFYEYNQLHVLPDHFVHRVNWRGISDLRYLREFPDEIKGHGLPALENRTSITQNLEKRHMSAEITMFENLLKKDPLDNRDDAVNKFPELRYSLREQRLGGNWGPLFRLDIKAVQFGRNGPSYDKLIETSTDPDQMNLVPSDRQDGMFNVATDLMRTGQRLEFSPQISMPFQIWRKIEFTPSVRLREYQYRWNVDQQMINSGFSPTASRRYVETEAVVKTEFNRVFEASSGNKYKHSIEPELTYAVIPWMRQPRHPFFGDYTGQKYQRTFDPISDGDLNSKNRVQFDYSDRVFEKRIVDLGITQYLVKKNKVNGVYENLAKFRISQSYDYREASESKNPQPWSTINALLDLRLNHVQVLSANVYNPYAHFANSSSRIRLVNDREDYAEISYTHTVLVDDTNNVQPDTATENIGGGLGFTTRYLNLAGQMDYSNITKSIRSWKYIMQLLTPGQCWGIRFTHEQILGGEKQYYVNFEFDFGGNDKKKQLPPRLM